MLEDLICISIVALKDNEDNDIVTVVTSISEIIQCTLQYKVQYIFATGFEKTKHLAKKSKILFL